MFRRILLPTDFSTASEWVFDDAVRIAGAEGAELVILHIRMTRTSRPDELRFPADPSLYEYAEQYELTKLRERVQRVNTSVQTRLVVQQAPDPGGAICRAAKDEAADLIIMSTHARHHVAHLILGSTTRNVITNPPAPVLAIRYGIPKRTALQRLVVPVHPKQVSTGALDLARRIAAEKGGELHLITICDERDLADAERHLAEVANGARTAVIRGSDIDSEIVRYAERVDADVVVLNAKQELSSLKVDVIRHAKTPVLIAP
ncbi:MAG: putative Universal stress protein [Alphaproteobacteria bacterium]|nr:putative Universal stress protein [Alphaproteobacteria bacterium]